MFSMKDDIRKTLPSDESELRGATIEVVPVGSVFNDGIVSLAVAAFDHEDELNVNSSVYAEVYEPETSQPKNLQIRPKAGLVLPNRVRQALLEYSMGDVEMSEDDVLVLNLGGNHLGEFTYDEIKDVEVDPISFATGDYLTGLVFR